MNVKCRTECGPKHRQKNLTKAKLIKIHGHLNSNMTFQVSFQKSTETTIYCALNRPVLARSVNKRKILDCENKDQSVGRLL